METIGIQLYNSEEGTFIGVYKRLHTFRKEKNNFLITVYTKPISGNWAPKLDTKEFKPNEKKPSNIEHFY